MINRIEKAVALKRSHNCCQAVLLAYADQLDLSEAQLLQLGAGFGLGMGCMEATCGALCGAQMVLGLTRTDGKTVMPAAKALVAAFRQNAGATVCGELKGVKTGQVLCSCENCVRYAVECLEQQL